MDHPCQVWSKLAQWFQRRRLKCEKLTTMTTTDDGRFIVAKAHPDPQVGELKMTFEGDTICIPYHSKFSIRQIFPLVYAWTAYFENLTRSYILCHPPELTLRFLGTKLYAVKKLLKSCLSKLMKSYI